MRTIGCVFACAAMLLTVGIQACCADDAAGSGNVMMVQGAVTSVDWVGSVLAVDNVNYSTTGDTKIMKGTDWGSLTGINVGDSVTVIYRIEDDGTLRALKITIAYQN